MKHRKPIPEEVPLLLFPEWMRNALKVIAERREKVDPALLRGLGQARERANAALVSRWDFLRRGH